MKTFLSLLLITILGCARVPVEPEGNGYPVIKFTGIENNEYGEPTYKFQLLKDGDEGELYYSGYSKESPLYKKQVKKSDGWKEEFIGWCGTGLENINLKTLPNTTPLMVYSHENSQPWKLGVIFYKKVNGEFDGK